MDEILTIPEDVSYALKIRNREYYRFQTMMKRWKRAMAPNPGDRDVPTNYPDTLAAYATQLVDQSNRLGRECLSLITAVCEYTAAPWYIAGSHLYEEDIQKRTQRPVERAGIH